MPGLLDQRRSNLRRGYRNAVRGGLLGQMGQAASGLLGNIQQGWGEMMEAPGQYWEDALRSDLGRYGAELENFRQGNLPSEEFMEGMLDTVNPYGLVGMTVFHGSPHKWDRVDLSKVGTGEGAQAYGHGFYVAENPDTAKFYAKALAKDKNISDLNSKMDFIEVGGEPVLKRYDIEMDDAFAEMLKTGDVNQALAHGKDRLNQWERLAVDETYPFRSYAVEKAEAWRRLVPEIEGGKVSYTGGSNLYELDLPDETIDKMLDWDAPLSEQPESVRDLLLRHRKEWGTSFHYGDEAYRDIVQAFSRGDKRAMDWAIDRGYDPYSAEFGAMDATQLASEYLNSLGIPGIRYFDGFSRAAGEGTRNFVIFDEQYIKPLKRNDESIGLLDSAAEKKKRIEALRAEANANRGLLEPDTSYRGQHQPPTKEGHNTLDDMSDMYPDDVYDPKVSGRYYGHGEPALDNISARIIAKARGNPDAEITIYRAVPKGVEDINPGDWVTINPEYARMHGTSWVDSGSADAYDIIEMQVKAKDLTTEANSIHEFGYMPE